MRWMRGSIRGLGVVVAMLVVGTCAFADDPDPLRVPDAVGDQLIFYYDTRTEFTTFFAIRNTSNEATTVTVLFYGPTFSTPFSKALTLAAGALAIVDVGELRGEGLPSQPGAAFVTAVNLRSEPIVSRALTGNFTVANLQTGSAWGAAAAARSAVDDDNDPSPKGTVIGDRAFLRPIQPDALVLAAYYDPESLAPVSKSGNQLIFVTFEDIYDANYSAGLGSTTWRISTTRAGGVDVGDTQFTANGVTVTDLASVAGPGVNGAAGGMAFDGAPAGRFLSRMVYFAEALGTFGTGYLLPPR